jgi:hypothetical protein
LEHSYTLKNSSVLHILNASKANEGQYSCVAKNGLRSWTSNKFNLRFENGSWFLVSCFSIKILTIIICFLFAAEDDYKTIVFLSPNQTQTSGRRGEMVTLECLVNLAYPNATVTWRRARSKHFSLSNSRRHSSRPINKHKRFRIVGESNLQIERLEREDDDVYVCNASYRLDEFDISHQLQHKLSVNVLPERTTASSGNRVQKYVGQPARLDCGQIYSYPRPNVRWLKDGEHLQLNARFNLTHEKRYLSLSSHRRHHSYKGADAGEFAVHSQLFVSNLESQDTGIYQCIVENDLGTLATEYRVMVNQTGGQPLPPTGLRADLLDSRTVSISWDDSSTFDSNDLLGFTVHYVGLGSGELERQEATDRPFVRLDKLRPYTRYSAYVRSYSSQGASEPSETITVETGEERPIEVPFVQLQPINSTSLLVDWDELSRDEARGRILKYRIDYKQLDQVEIEIIEVGALRSDFTVPNLRPGTTYEVRVLAANSKGFPGKEVVDDVDWATVRMPKSLPKDVYVRLSLQLTAEQQVQINWRLNSETFDKFDFAYQIKTLKLSHFLPDSKMAQLLNISSSQNHVIVSNLSEGLHRFDVSVSFRDYDKIVLDSASIEITRSSVDEDLNLIDSENVTKMQTLSTLKETATPSATKQAEATIASFVTTETTATTESIAITDVASETNTLTSTLSSTASTTRPTSIVLVDLATVTTPVDFDDILSNEISNASVAEQDKAHSGSTIKEIVPTAVNNDAVSSTTSDQSKFNQNMTHGSPHENLFLQPSNKITITTDLSSSINGLDPSNNELEEFTISTMETNTNFNIARLPDLNSTLANEKQFWNTLETQDNQLLNQLNLSGRNNLNDSLVNGSTESTEINKRTDESSSIDSIATTVSTTTLLSALITESPYSSTETVADCVCSRNESGESTKPLVASIDVLRVIYDFDVIAFSAERVDCRWRSDLDSDQVQFYIRYNLALAQDADETLFVRTSDQNVTIDRLLPYTSYNFALYFELLHPSDIRLNLTAYHAKGLDLGRVTLDGAQPDMNSTYTAPPVSSSSWANVYRAYRLVRQSRTMPSVPDRPAEFTGIPLNSHQVQLSWRAPLRSNGPIESYEVLHVIGAGSSQLFEHWNRTRCSGDQYAVLIDQLLPENQYHFVLRAIGSNGLIGAGTSQLVLRTLSMDSWLLAAIARALCLDSRSNDIAFLTRSRPMRFLSALPAELSALLHHIALPLLFALTLLILSLLCLSIVNRYVLHQSFTLLRLLHVDFNLESNNLFLFSCLRICLCDVKDGHKYAGKRENNDRSLNANLLDESGEPNTCCSDVLDQSNDIELQHCANNQSTVITNSPGDHPQMDPPSLTMASNDCESSAFDTSNSLTTPTHTKITISDSCGSSTHSLCTLTPTHSTRRLTHFMDERRFQSYPHPASRRFSLLPEMPLTQRQRFASFAGLLQRSNISSAFPVSIKPDRTGAQHQLNDARLIPLLLPANASLLTAADDHIRDYEQTAEEDEEEEEESVHMLSPYRLPRLPNFDSDSYV